MNKPSDLQCLYHITQCNSSERQLYEGEVRGEEVITMNIPALEDRYLFKNMAIHWIWYKVIFTLLKVLHLSGNLEVRHQTQPDNEVSKKSYHRSLRSQQQHCYCHFHLLSWQVLHVCPFFWSATGQQPLQSLPPSVFWQILFCNFFDEFGKFLSQKLYLCKLLKSATNAHPWQGMQVLSPVSTSVTTSYSFH